MIAISGPCVNRSTFPAFRPEGPKSLPGLSGCTKSYRLIVVRDGARVRLFTRNGNGDDLRNLPLHLRKTNLARLLARRPEGIFVSEFEQGEIGPDLFRQACKFGLEGLVSKRRESVYRGGRSPNWIKVKNRSHPALNRVKDRASL